MINELSSTSTSSSTV